MQGNNNSNIIIRLLISPRLRILRYGILFTFILFISASFMWFMEEKGLIMNPVEKYGGVLFFMFIFLGGSYLNIYVLTPRFLLKNRLGIYFASLSGIVLIIMIIIFLVRVVYVAEDNPSDETNYFVVVINTVSSTLATFLLFVGMTTLVIFKQWIWNMQKFNELESTTLQLELKLLENQINPHFLFNMLNNANIMIKKEPDIAIHIIAKLEEMLRYQMDKSNSEKVYLKEEISFLTDFLELEKTRRDYFSYSVSEEGEVDNLQIPPLLFITLVENAVKHNQDSQTASYVHLLFKVTDKQLIFICENSIPLKPSNNLVGGIGLTNIERRLDLLYKGNYSLERIKTETNYTVKLELKL